MAIAFTQEKKKQKILLTVFVILFMATAVILIQWVVRKNSPEKFTGKTVSPTFRQPDVDFKILESQMLKDLEVFESVKPFEGKVGRDNPFLPY